MLTNLGAAIRSERSDLGMSQDELARRAGLHRTYVSDVERGVRNPSVESVEKLASALQISISRLFQKAGDASPRSLNTVEILLIEDNLTDVELTLRAFENASITNPVRILRDGQEALDFLFSALRAGENQPQSQARIILLDLDLPKVSGIDVLTRLKADQRTRKIPVIVLTASDHDRDMQACLRLGCEEYIVKPVGFENFNQITTHFRLAWTLVTNGATRREGLIAPVSEF